jgi:phosphoribosylcarboxyaminoimidazole (NCAIR) mutase
MNVKSNNVPYKNAKIMSQASTPGLVKRLQNDGSPVALESQIAIAGLANYFMAMVEAIDSNTVTPEMTEILMDAVAFMQDLAAGSTTGGITLN